MFIDSPNSDTHTSLAHYITLQKHYQSRWLTKNLSGYFIHLTQCTFLLFVFYYNHKPVKCTRVNKVIIINGERIKHLFFRDWMNTWKRRDFTFHVSSFCQMMNCWKFFQKRKIQRGLCCGPLTLCSPWLSHFNISRSVLRSDTMSNSNNIS